MKRSEKIALGICGLFLIPTIGLSSAIGIYSAVNPEGNTSSLASVSNSSSQSTKESFEENEQEENSPNFTNDSFQGLEQELQGDSPLEPSSSSSSKENSSSSNSMTEERKSGQEVAPEEEDREQSPDNNQDFPPLTETPIIQANTREKVMEIEENAKEEAKYASDDSIRMAVNYIRYDSQDFFQNNKIMEEALYYGYYLQYACQDDPEKEIFSDLGKSACLSVAYVYRGVDNENSSFTQTNLDKVKATLEMIDNPESLNTDKTSSNSGSSLSSSRTPSL